MNKTFNSYKTISEVVKILGLKSKRGQTIPTHTIRFWEKKFKQIKPKIFNNNRRYYDQNSIDILKKIKYLLKVEGLTIKGVKKILDKNESIKLDDYLNKPINTQNNNLKTKLNKISKIITELKDLK